MDFHRVAPSFVTRWLIKVPHDIKNSSNLIESILCDSPERDGGCQHDCLPKDTVLKMLGSVANSACTNMEEVTTRLLIMKMTADHSTTLVGPCAPSVLF